MELHNRLSFLKKLTPPTAGQFAQYLSNFSSLNTLNKLELSPPAGRFAQHLFNSSSNENRFQDLFIQTAVYGLAALAVKRYTRMNCSVLLAYGILRGVTDRFTGDLFYKNIKNHTCTNENSSFVRKIFSVIVERAAYATIMFTFLKATEKCFKFTQLKRINPLNIVKIERAFLLLTVGQIVSSFFDARREKGERSRGSNPQSSSPTTRNLSRPKDTSNTPDQEEPGARKTLSTPNTNEQQGGEPIQTPPTTTSNADNQLEAQTPPTTATTNEHHNQQGAQTPPTTANADNQLGAQTHTTPATTNSPPKSPRSSDNHTKAKEKPPGAQTPSGSSNPNQPNKLQKTTLSKQRQQAQKISHELQKKNLSRTKKEASGETSGTSKSPSSSQRGGRKQNDRKKQH